MRCASDMSVRMEELIVERKYARLNPHSLPIVQCLGDIAELHALPANIENCAFD